MAQFHRCSPFETILASYASDTISVLDIPLPYGDTAAIANFQRASGPHAMQALRKTEPSHGLTLTQADMPAPGPGEVLLRVHSAGVCGTDLHIAEWTRSYHFLTPALPVTIEIGRASCRERG